MLRRFVDTKMKQKSNKSLFSRLQVQRMSELLAVASCYQQLIIQVKTTTGANRDPEKR